MPPPAMTLPGTEGAAAPFCSPDSRQIAFVSLLRLKKVDVTGGPSQVRDEELLAKFDGGLARVEDWSPDGHSLLYGLMTLQKLNLDLSILPLDGDKKPRSFLQTEFDEKEGGFSPNAPTQRPR